MSKYLFEKIDNAPLIIFRIFLGLLLMAESFGAILTGWVNDIFVSPKLHFPHIGFEFLSPLYGPWMYVHFILMGIFAFGITLGYRYKLNTFLFTLFWFISFILQKESYNNHYYLVVLVGFTMLFLPANGYASVDAKQNPEIKSLTMPRWVSLVMILQISIVYFFATLHKFYPDWLDGTFVKILYHDKHNFPVIGPLLAQDWFAVFIAYAGIAFDGLIIPLLLYKPTRNYAFFASIIFHLFNAIVLQIGIFPFFALSYAVFFYSPNSIRKIFFRNKPTPQIEGLNYQNQKALKYILIPFFILQILLPLRHYLIPGDVLWTEEGHRLSWRMMLRSRDGYVDYHVINKKTKEKIPYNIFSNLNGKQYRLASAHADGIWQMAQHIKKEFAQKGIDVAVYVDSNVSVNGSIYQPFIDIDVDLAAQKWDHFRHHSWILLHE